MEDQIPGQIELTEYLSEIETDQQDKFEILNYIPVGSKNAIKRVVLCIRTGLKDRPMRDCLHYARMKIPVINLQNGKGYFIPDMNTQKDVKMLIRWVRQEKSRIRESELIVAVAEKTLRNCGIEWRDDEWQNGACSQKRL